MEGWLVMGKVVWVVCVDGFVIVWMWRKRKKRASVGFGLIRRKVSKPPVQFCQRVTPRHNKRPSSRVTMHVSRAQLGANNMNQISFYITRARNIIVVYVPSLLQQKGEQTPHLQRPRDAVQRTYSEAALLIGI